MTFDHWPKTNSLILETTTTSLSDDSVCMQVWRRMWSGYVNRDPVFGCPRVDSELSQGEESRGINLIFWTRGHKSPSFPSSSLPLAFLSFFLLFLLPFFYGVARNFVGGKEGIEDFHFGFLMKGPRMLLLLWEWSDGLGVESKDRRSFHYGNGYMVTWPRQRENGENEDAKGPHSLAVFNPTMLNNGRRYLTFPLLLDYVPRIEKAFLSINVLFLELEFGLFRWSGAGILGSTHSIHSSTEQNPESHTWNLIGFQLNWDQLVESN